MFLGDFRCLERMIFLTNQVGDQQKRTQRYLPDTAVSLKMGDFNTPPVFSAFNEKPAVKCAINDYLFVPLNFPNQNKGRKLSILSCRVISNQGKELLFVPICKLFSSAKQIRI